MAEGTKRLEDLVDELRAENERLRRLIAERDERIARLERVVEELQRRGKRQAAPFSKGAPKAQPKRPGRKAGKEYGTRSERQPARRVDRRVETQCPLWCDDPRCGGRVRLSGKVRSYVVDLPPIVAETTEYTNHYGACEECGKRVWRRGCGQAGDPFGPAKVHIGAGVVSLASYLKTAAGMSFGKIRALLREMAGLTVAVSTLCRALQRLARRGEPVHRRVIRLIRGSPVVYADETGWRIGGHPAWLWAFTNGQATVYAILRGRGYAQAESIMGSDFAGTLGVDGWAPYRSFKQAEVQSCLAHLLRRCDAVLELVTKGAVRFPRAVKRILQAALDLRDRRDAGQISEHGLSVVRGRLEAQMDRCLMADFSNEHNARFAQHLARYREALLLFLYRDDVEATNWPAEQSIRPAVVNRKTCAGNRSDLGARTLGITMTIVRSCQQQKLASLSVLRRIFLGQPVNLALAQSR
jgi:transposase